MAQRKITSRGGGGGGQTWRLPSERPNVRKAISGRNRQPVLVFYSKGCFRTAMLRTHAPPKIRPELGAAPCRTPAFVIVRNLSLSKDRGGMRPIGRDTTPLEWEELSLISNRMLKN